MMPLSMGRIAEMAGARLVAGPPDLEVTSVVTDSREVAEGVLFVALEGPARNGADYVAEAASGGVGALLVPEARLAAVEAALRAAGGAGSAARQAFGPPAILAADDTLAALGALAGAYRAGLGAVVVGVTGSTGKTTTKDLIAAALSPSIRVVASVKSHNNEIGLPLTLLAADPSTDVIVAEMAMRGTGQIAELARMARPRIGVVTNVGVTHFELLGSLDAIANAKGELLEALPQDGTAIINGDDRHSPMLAGLTKAEVVRFGLAEDNDIIGEEISLAEDGSVAFTARSGGETARVTLPFFGRHNVYNALAALAVAGRLGVGLGPASRGLGQASLSPMRMHVFTTDAGVTVIDDCYNANPTSMAAALDSLREMPAEGRRVAVLGEMAELGSLSVNEHIAVGEHAVRAGVELLVTVGPGADPIGSGAMKAGLTRDATVPFADAESAAAAAGDLVRPGDIVLVKASRAVGLERVVEVLAQ